VLDVHVEHIQAKVGISKSTASQFMAMLQRGLVTSVRKGQWTRYERRDRVAALAEQVRVGL